MSFTVIIPARFASTRLPGKPLQDIGGQPMIQRVHSQAMKGGASRVIIATDHEQIAQASRLFGAEVVMTATTHRSGSERLAEAVDICHLDDDEIVVNVQGDEPLLPPEVIAQVASNLERSEAPMATLCEPITQVEDVLNPNVVKVVCDEQGFALYFSRAPIPWVRDQFSMSGNTLVVDQLKTSPCLRHIGLYAYRAGFLRRYVDLPVTSLEQFEALEQLRALGHGYRIHVGQVKSGLPAGVDTPEDLQRVREWFKTVQD